MNFLKTATSLSIAALVRARFQQLKPSKMPGFLTPFSISAEESTLGQTSWIPLSRSIDGCKVEVIPAVRSS